MVVVSRLCSDLLVNLFWKQLAIRFTFNYALVAVSKCRPDGDPRLVAVKVDIILEGSIVMDMVIFRTIFFELLVFFTFTLLTIHFAY